MTNAATFNSMCTSILQRMIETVPTTVTLSDVISPYEVKPSGLQLTLLSGGTQLTFSGDIRVRTTSRTVSGVQVVYTDRNGAAGGTISTTLSGAANGFDDSFSVYPIWLALFQPKLTGGSFMASARTSQPRPRSHLSLW